MISPSWRIMLTGTLMRHVASDNINEGKQMKKIILFVMIASLLMNFQGTLALTDAVPPIMPVGVMALNPQTATAQQGESFWVELNAHIPSDALGNYIRTTITYDSTKLSVTRTDNGGAADDWELGAGFGTAIPGKITYYKQRNVGSPTSTVHGEFLIGNILFMVLEGSEGAASIIISNDFSGTPADGDPVDTLVQAGVTNYITVVSSSTISIVAAPAPCTNECSIAAAQECVADEIVTYRTCGNFDDDSCLEWSGSATCAGGGTCVGGTCVLPPPPAPETFTLTSTAFANEGAIPLRNAHNLNLPDLGLVCLGGSNLPPALAIQNTPAGTKNLVLIMDDADAVSEDFPDPFVHCALWNIPQTTTEIPADWVLPAIVVKGRNDFQAMPGLAERSGYAGPCPPPGQTHLYTFHLFALDGPSLELGAPAFNLLAVSDGQGENGIDNDVLTVSELRAWVDADANINILGEATLTGTFTNGLIVPPVPVCGDGTTDAGETCDDDNTLAGDGCDANCMTEGIIIVENICGDGVIRDTEQCDGSQLGGNNCITVAGDFTAGTLSCAIDCSFDVSGCSADAGGVSLGGNCDDDRVCAVGGECIEGTCRDVDDILSRIGAIIRNNNLRLLNKISGIAGALRDFFA